jgi:hypothetical protein
MTETAVRQRATSLRYDGLEVFGDSLVAHYDLDGRTFQETVVFEGVATLQRPEVVALAQLWYLLAGLSYYKAGAATRLDLAHTPVGPAGRALLAAALHDGLGEFAYKNQLKLDDVEIVGGLNEGTVALVDADRRRVLTPFGGGIDSVVTVSTLAEQVDQKLFVVSPPSGRFTPLEATAAVTNLSVARATRVLDPALLAKDPTFFNGHVPVTAMITLLATVAAVADGRGGVAMSNEHSASVPNLQWNGRDINHQWSKSWIAEQLIADAVNEAVGPLFVVASVLRARSELWVAKEFAQLSEFHATFRSCNRAYAQQLENRAPNWCGECDKCLFIHLVLAPFIERHHLAELLGVEPLADPKRHDQLRTLIGLGEQRKPFECVGDPTECAVALSAVAADAAWRDEQNVAELASLVSVDVTLDDLMEPQGVNRVPAEWIR